MGAVFQVVVFHDLLDKGQQLFFVAVPAGFDGGFAGYGLEHFVPDGVLAFPASAELIGGDGLQGIGGIFGA